MELSNEDGFLEELLGFGRETWGHESNQITEINTLFTNTSCWGSNNTTTTPLNYFQDSSTTTTPLIPTNLPTTTYQDISILPIIKPTLDDNDYSNFNDDIYNALEEAKYIAAAAPPPPPPASEELILMTASNNNQQQQMETSSSSPFPINNLQDQQDYSLSSIMEDDHEQAAPGFLQEEDYNNNNNNDVQNYREDEMGVHTTTSCKVEEVSTTHQSSEFNMGLMCMEFNNGSKNKVMKKLEGNRQPSKNLMAERRRRKRLNDRLSMLRSVVPKISKMDRTSILGDTIDYMKELLEKINNLQEEIDVSTTSSTTTTTHDQLNVVSIFKDLIKPNDVLVRNSPKFDVERRNMDTRVEICCATKPGLLLSTISALEQLGLEIQQCVISCFNDFSLQASCSEEMEQRTVISSEDVKQALFRNAGYGGRCL